MNLQFQTVVHVAAAPVDGIQKCSRCGVVLVDARGAMSMDGASMLFWSGFVGVFERLLDGKIVSTGGSCALSHDAMEPDEYPCGAKQ